MDDGGFQYSDGTPQSEPQSNLDMKNWEGLIVKTPDEIGKQPSKTISKPTGDDLVLTTNEKQNENQRRNTRHEESVKKKRMYSACKGLMPLGAFFLCVTLMATIAFLVCTILLFSSSTLIATSREDITRQATPIAYAIDNEYRINPDISMNGYIKGEVSLTTENIPATLAVSRKQDEIISKTYEDVNRSFTDDTYILPVQFYSHGNVSFEASVMGESDGIIGASLSRYDLLGINHVVKRENKVFTKGQRIFFQNYSSIDPGYYSLTMYTLTINGSKIEGTIETRTITYNILDPNQIFENNCTIDNEVKTSCSLSIQQSITDIKSYGIVLIFKKYAGKLYQVKVSGTTGNKLKAISFPVALVVSVIGLLSMGICVTCTCIQTSRLKPGKEIQHSKPRESTSGGKGELAL